MLRWRRLGPPAFLLLLGLVWAVAHALAHDVVVQPAGAGHGAGHPDVGSYAAYLPTSLALCLTLAAAVATGVALGKHWAGRSGRSLWLFGVVPVLGFAADTLTEATSHGSTAETAAALVPVFLIGLLVQIPFALVVVGLVGGVFWLVEHLAYVLRKSVEIAPYPAAPSIGWAADAGDAPALLLVGAGRSRAPPPQLEL